jgi:hypothetical protein
VRISCAFTGAPRCQPLEGSHCTEAKGQEADFVVIGKWGGIGAWANDNCAESRQKLATERDPSIAAAGILYVNHV